MNTYSRTILRIAAFATGLYYWYESFQQMSNHPPLNGIAKLIDYGANALCLFAVGVFLLGIGIGIWKIVLNEKFLR